MKTLNDLQKDLEWKYGTFVALKNEAKKWKAHLEYRLQHLPDRNNCCSDVAYKATEGIVNLRKIEDEQLKFVKVEILGQIELLNKFFNLKEKKTTLKEELQKRGLDHPKILKQLKDIEDGDLSNSSSNKSESFDKD